MKIITIKDVVRKDVPIYYRMLYSGIAVLEITKGPAEYRIDFSVEFKPTGHKEISITFVDEVDYPRVPLNKELKKFIDAMDSAGELPGT